MKKTMMVLACALALVGCNGVECVLPDAGAPNADDAGSPVTSGTISSVEACRMLEWAHVANRASQNLGTCDSAACPWPAIGGPGLPVESCDAALVYRCGELLRGANDCTEAGAVVSDPEACPREACR